MLLSGSTASADCHSSSSKEVAQTQSRPLSYPSLLAPTQGGSEFSIVHHGLGYCGVNSEEVKKTQVRTEATRQNHLRLKEKSAHHALMSKLEMRG